MTTAELATHALVCEKTIRRYVRAGIARPRVVRMPNDGFRYDFQAEEIDQILIARDQKRRHLERVSPPLGRYIRRRTGVGGVSRERWPPTAEGQQPAQQVRCPRCGHVHCVESGPLGTPPRPPGGGMAIGS